MPKSPDQDTSPIPKSTPIPISSIMQRRQHPDILQPGETHPGVVTMDQLDDEQLLRSPLFSRTLSAQDRRSVGRSLKVPVTSKKLG